jgi:hypothetical protein
MHEHQSCGERLLKSNSMQNYYNLIYREEEREMVSLSDKDS